MPVYDVGTGPTGVGGTVEPVDEHPQLHNNHTMEWRIMSHCNIEASIAVSSASPLAFSSERWTDHSQRGGGADLRTLVLLGADVGALAAAGVLDAAATQGATIRPAPSEETKLRVSSSTRDRSVVRLSR
jgi:hypothetical protein